MSNNSTLLQEIEEDMNRRKLEAFWKKFGPPLFIALLLIVAGTFGFNKWQEHVTHKNQEATLTLLNIINLPEPTAEKIMTETQAFRAKFPNAKQDFLAKFQEANAALANNDNTQATKIYDELSNSSSTDLILRQMATLYSIKAQMDYTDPKLLLARLQPLTEQGPWQFTAREYSGFLYLKAGEKEKAKETFAALAKEPTIVVPDVTERAQAMSQYLSESK